MDQYTVEPTLREGGILGYPPEPITVRGLGPREGGKVHPPLMFFFGVFLEKLKCEKCPISTEGVFNFTGHTVQPKRSQCSI